MMGYLLDQGHNNLFSYHQHVPLMCRIVGSELMGMEGIAAGASIAQTALPQLADEDLTTANGVIYDFTLTCERTGADITVLAAMLHDAIAVMEARSRQEAAMIANQMLRRLPAFITAGRMRDVYPHLMCVGAALTTLLYDQPAARWMCLFVPVILCRAAVILAGQCRPNRIGLVQTVTREITTVLANNHRMLGHLRYIENLLAEHTLCQAK